MQTKWEKLEVLWGQLGVTIPSRAVPQLKAEVKKIEKLSAEQLFKSLPNNLVTIDILNSYVEESERNKILKGILKQAA